MHAPKTAGGNGYCYDNNGNVQWRYEGGRLWLHSWNADNKAQSIQQYAMDWATTIGSPVQYAYDADGVLVRRTHNGVTTVYVGNHAEWNSSTGWTNYYHFNGQRIAKRNSSGVFWLHGDHLGSVSLATNSAGGTHSQVRYGPFGSERWTNGAMPTGYKFTDQRAEDTVGLYDYDARLYSPALARFISPDSIVPDKKNILDFNRYAYVRHNPLIYTDPSGNIPIPLFTGLIGGVAGGLIGSGADLLYQAAVEGKSLNDINWGSVAQSGIAGAATGAIIGATGGAAAGVLGTGSTLALQAGLGSMGGAVASQAGAAIGGSINSHLNGTDPAREADALGFGNPGKMTVDAMAGAAGPFVSAGVARTATKSAQIVASQMVRAQPQAAMTQISVAATSQSVRVSIKQITTYTLVSTAPRSIQNAARNGAGSHPFSVTSMADGFVQNVVTKQAESACGSRC
jgi:RHS repeat-associated protein